MNVEYLILRWLRWLIEEYPEFIMTVSAKIYFIFCGATIVLERIFLGE